MTTAARATAATLKEAAAMASAIQKAGMANGHAVVELGNGLNDACTHRQPASLTLYLKALPKLIDRIEACLDSIVPFQRLMEEIEEDEAYVQAHIGALGKLTQMVDASRAQATSQFQACKQLKATGLKTFAEMTQSVERAERLLASHDKWVNDMQKTIAGAAAKAATIVAGAEKAAAKGDAKALAAARKGFDALEVAELVSFPQDLERKVATTLQQMSVVAADKGAGAAIAAEIKGSLSLRQEMAPALAKLAAAKKTIDALAVAGAGAKKGAGR